MENNSEILVGRTNRSGCGVVPESTEFECGLNSKPGPFKGGRGGSPVACLKNPIECEPMGLPSPVSHIRSKRPYIQPCQ